jgi:hypothetical protein
VVKVANSEPDCAVHWNVTVGSNVMLVTTRETL